MMGGVTIKTHEQAQVYTELLREPAEIGAHVEEPTCVKETDPAWLAALEAGRECPRVDLDRDSALPYELLLLAASEHTRPLFDAYFRAAAGHLPAEERAAILSRVHAGLMADAVVEKLYPKPKDSPQERRR